MMDRGLDAGTRVKIMKRRYGIADVPGGEHFYRRFTAMLERDHRDGDVEIMFQRVARQDATGRDSDSVSVLKIRAFDAVQAFESQAVDAVLLPCLRSQSVLAEIEAETAVPIVRLMEALKAVSSKKYPSGARIGILGPDWLRNSGYFEREFTAEHWQLLYPAADIQRDGIKAVVEAMALPPEAVTMKLTNACEDLMRQGAESIIVCDSVVEDAVSDLRMKGFPVIDALAVYAEYAVSVIVNRKKKPFKIGVAGGVGPAATVDFLDKVVRNTPAQRDQDHVKMVVEQNPQIPDRTAYLLGQGADPTIALYATCRRLEAAGADLIAIPCNTAHAFVERIQPHLSIPIVNMLHETADYVRRNHKNAKKIGLLATRGTIASGVYHEAIAAAGFELLVPDEAHQARVMNAIYGPLGVKAGFTEGECVEDVLAALASLARRGAEIIVLGCTELPLLLSQTEAFPVADRTVVILDPTDILAKTCVDRALHPFKE